MGRRMNYDRPQFRTQGRETINLREEREHEKRVMQFLEKNYRQQQQSPKRKHKHYRKHHRRQKMEVEVLSLPEISTDGMSTLRPGDDVVMDILHELSAEVLPLLNLCRQQRTIINHPDGTKTVTPWEDY